MSDCKESLAVLGPQLSEARLLGLQAMVADLERVASIVQRTERSNQEEPLLTLRLRPV